MCIFHHAFPHFLSLSPIAGRGHFRILFPMSLLLLPLLPLLLLAYLRDSDHEVTRKGVFSFSFLVFFCHDGQVEVGYDGTGLGPMRAMGVVIDIDRQPDRQTDTKPRTRAQNEWITSNVVAQLDAASLSFSFSFSFPSIVHSPLFPTCLPPSSGC